MIRRAGKPRRTKKAESVHHAGHDAELPYDDVLAPAAAREVGQLHDGDVGVAVGRIEVRSDEVAKHRAHVGHADSGCGVRRLERGLSRARLEEGGDLSGGRLHGGVVDMRLRQAELPASARISADGETYEP